MSRSKSATPAVKDLESHPANDLIYVDEEIKAQLLKTPPKLLIENDTYEIQLKELRNDWRYAFVLQWLAYFRGAIKLIGEPFSVELIEEELVGLTEVNLMNKIATNLASVLIGSKVSIEDFSFKVRYLFGDTINLLGTEDAPRDFESLSLVDKFDVLYNLIFQVQYTDIFRKQVEKYEKESELRFEPIFEDDTESYFLLSDNRIYHRTIKNYPEISIPRKYKNAKNFDPEVELANIEPEFEWELVAVGIYQIHEFLISIKSNKRLKPLFSNIKDHIDDLAREDLTTRKKVVKRKREQLKDDLLVNRKRSSRLIQKEEQMRLDKLREQEELERQKAENEKLKTQRNLKKKINALKRDIEERLRAQTTSRRTASENIDYIPSNLDEIELGEGEWLFECYCGIKEKNYDDGVKLISCERCHRWQHLKCQDRLVQQELIRNANDVFICNWCKQDLEHEVLKKLDDEKLERERELEEKARLKAVAKQKAEEERLRLEEEERLRKEEIEKERQRRIEEREKLRLNGIYTTPESTSPVPASSTSQSNNHFVPFIQPHSAPSAPSNPSNGPLLGTFQAYVPPPPSVIPQVVNEAPAFESQLKSLQSQPSEASVVTPAPLSKIDNVQPQEPVRSVEPADSVQLLEEAAKPVLSSIPQNTQSETPNGKETSPSTSFSIQSILQ